MLDGGVGDLGLISYAAKWGEPLTTNDIVYFSSMYLRHSFNHILDHAALLFLITHRGIGRWATLLSSASLPLFSGAAHM